VSASSETFNQCVGRSFIVELDCDHLATFSSRVEDECTGSHIRECHDLARAFHGARIVSPTRGSLLSWAA
jgi:hypothetical protein